MEVKSREDSGVRHDWLVVLLPTALSLRNLQIGSANTLMTLLAILVIGAFVGIAFFRPVEQRFATQYGPMVLFFAGSALVLIRPSSSLAAVMAVLVGALSLRLSSTVEAQRLIVSLIDGLGLYCVANVALYLFGFRSGTEIEGWRLFLSTGVENRIIFPLERSLSLPPVIAAMYIAGVLFLSRKQTGWWRTFRLVSAAAAVLVILGSATRVPAGAAVIILVVAIIFPFLRRYVAVAVVAIAACSSVVLPKIIASAQWFLEPIASLLSSRRNTRGETLTALNGRDYIWDQALGFWQERVNDLFNVSFGFGMEGHYKSGASASYFRLLSDSITRDPDRTVSVHNSFLQQLFDGGVVGWLLMTVSLVWVALRLSAGISQLGNVGVAGVLAFSVLIVCSMTEVLLHPSVLSYWILLLFIGIGCQLLPEQNEPQSSTLPKEVPYGSAPQDATKSIPYQ